ncbi:MAG: sn-glycerol 3-phosphate transport system substrate-binding protein, partial [Chloroflexota bacterium]|nr:sn-glycerol 3-phosphate transport system substrate-binding protein [Chloroflexota bacterium]
MLRLGSVPQLLLGIGLLGLAGALLLNQPLAGRTAARTVIFSPVVLSGVAIGIVWIYIGLPAEKQQAAVKWITFATSPEITTFWAKTTGYMPVRKRAAQSAEMQVYFKERPTFKTAVDQLPKTRPQDAARVFVPNGDQIIGKGL